MELNCPWQLVSILFTVAPLGACGPSAFDTSSPSADTDTDTSAGSEGTDDAGTDGPGSTGPGTAGGGTTTTTGPGPGSTTGTNGPGPGSTTGTTGTTGTGPGSTTGTGPEPPSLHPCHSLDQTACLGDSECLWIAPQPGPWAGVDGCVKPCIGLEENACDGAQGCYNRLVSLATGELVCEPDCWRREQANCETDIRCSWDRYEADTVWYECVPNCASVPNTSPTEWECIWDYY